MPEPRSRRARIAVYFAVGLAIAVGLAEVSARIAEAAGPPTLRWYDATTQLKVEQMESVDGAEVVFVGTSMVWQGLVPEVFTTADPEDRTAFNAGLAGGVPVVVEPWLLEQVVPRLEPGLVVWGLSSMDLSASYGIDNLERYGDALETRTGWLSSTERTASRVSALVRYRSVLRNPSSLFGSERDRIEDDFADAALVLGEGGERRDFAIDTGELRGEQVAARLRQYAVDRADVAAIHRTIEALRSRGIEILLVEMPVPERYVALHPNGREDVERAHLTIETIAEMAAVDLIDLRHGFTDDDFVDYTHLDEAGARTLTTALAARLAGSGEASTPAPPPVDDGLLAEILQTTARAVDLNDTLYHYLLGGRPNRGQSEMWWGAAHYGHARDLTIAAGRSEVLFVGDSRMLNAADPESFTALDGRTSYNASLASAGPEVIDVWLREQAVALSEPEVVVYGLVPQRLRALRELEDSCLADISEWIEGSAIRDGLFAPVEAVAGLGFADLAYGDPPVPDPDPASPIHRLYRAKFAATGQRVAFEAAGAEELLEWTADITASEGSTLTWCDERIDAFAETVAYLESRGIAVVTVLMPVRPEDGTQWGAERREEIWTELEGFALDAGSAAVVDFRDLLTPGQFRDQWHANREGSEAFTRALVDALAALGL